MATLVILETKAKADCVAQAKELLAKRLPIGTAGNLAQRSHLPRATATLQPRPAVLVLVFS